MVKAEFVSDKLQGRKRVSGFTMIEIIIVFALIGILGAAMLGGNFLPTLLRSRDTKRKSDLAQVAKALEAYMNDKGQYPTASLDGKIMGCGTDGDEACEWGGAFSADEVIYMARLPSDSKAPSRQFRYEAGPSGIGWRLYARLENDRDPVLDLDGNGEYDPEVDNYGMECGTEMCDYGISSSNVTMETDLSGY